MFGALMGRHQARQEMDRRVEDASEPSGGATDVRHLAISRSEIQSPRSTFVRVKDGEFRYRGTLYDVVSEEWRGSVWHVWAYPDREEEHYTDLLAATMNTPVLGDETAPVQPRPVAYRPLALTPSARVVLPFPRLRTHSFPRFSFVGSQAPHLEVPHPPPWGDASVWWEPRRS